MADGTGSCSIENFETDNETKLGDADISIHDAYGDMHNVMLRCKLRCATCEKDDADAPCSVDELGSMPKLLQARLEKRIGQGIGRVEACRGRNL